MTCTRKWCVSFPYKVSSGPYLTACPSSSVANQTLFQRRHRLEKRKAHQTSHGCPRLLRLDPTRKWRYDFNAKTRQNQKSERQKKCDPASWFNVLLTITYELVITPIHQLKFDFGTRQELTSIALHPSGSKVRRVTDKKCEQGLGKHPCTATASMLDQGWESE